MAQWCMAFPNNIARVVIDFTLPNGESAAVVHHCRTGSGSDFDAARCLQLATLYDDWITNADFEGETNAPLINSMVTNATVDLVTVTGLETPATPSASVVVATAGVGAGDPVPAETALVTTWRTDFVGRSFRGRSYWPAFREAFNDAQGDVDGTSLAGIQTTMSALIDGLINQGGFRHGVYSRTLNVFTDTTSALARSVWHHQSRRNA